MEHIGYMSGTFDLFHIGHLNIIKKARAECDFLIVGVHESGAWKGKETFIPFEERLEIVGALKYVDLAIKSYKEDIDAIEAHLISKLFVGSDYRGSERFNRYTSIAAAKNVEICYFPYTTSTSSSQLRTALQKL